MRAPAYQWEILYETAILETDDLKLHAKISAAEAAIHKRLKSNEPDEIEAGALTHAMSSLRILRKERLPGGNGGG